MSGIVVCTKHPEIEANSSAELLQEEVIEDLGARDERAPINPPSAAPSPMNTDLAMMSTTNWLAADNPRTRKLYSRAIGWATQMDSQILPR
jgi:hypothetical protein